MIEYNMKIDKNEVLRYLGCNTEQARFSADDKLLSDIDASAKKVRLAAVPAYIYRILDTERCTDGIRLSGSSIVLTGSTAEEMLRECTSCIVFAATLGRQVDDLIRRNQIIDIASAVIMDSCASSGIESICDQLEDGLETELLQKGRYITDRFSPGYGDLPLNLQPEIIRTLSADTRAGLTVSSSMLLIPFKSVTAFIGISDRPQPRRITGCRKCTMKNHCKFRKAGNTCVSK